MNTEDKKYVKKLLIGFFIMSVVFLGLVIATVILENKDIITNQEQKTIIIGNDTVTVDRFLNVLID